MDLVKGLDLEGFSRVELARALESGVKEGLLEWHGKMLRKHFEMGAFQRYKYEKRSRGYHRRKQREKGHELPLVWSGTLRNQALRAAEIRVSGKYKLKGRAKFKGPGYILGRKRANYPHVKGELTKVTKGEERDLAKVMKAAVVGHLERERKRRGGGG